MDSREDLRKKLLKKTKEQINEKFAGKEIHIIKAVRLLSDLDSINNLLLENTSEWKLRSPTGEAAEAFNELEKNTNSIAEEKKKLNLFIEKEMKAEFPNFSQIATPVLGAKLLASAGSKQRLVFMPASTIQVLGAEKALFAHLRKNANSPKHGHLFNHPLMQKLPRVKRGKVARIIAGKLAIALKQDYFGGEDTSKKVLKELEDKVTEIANEPITPYQEKREKELIEAHTEGAKKVDEKKNKPESRTWTPEERRAYFAQQNNTGEKKESVAKREERKPSYEERPRQRSFAPRNREFSSPRRDRGFGGERRERSFNSEGSYGERRPSFGRDRPYSQRREGSFGEGRTFGNRDRPFDSRRERPYGEKQFSPREGSSQGYGRTKNRSFGKGRFNKPKHSFKKY